MNGLAVSVALVAVLLAVAAAELHRAGQSALVIVLAVACGILIVLVVALVCWLISLSDSFWNP